MADDSDDDKTEEPTERRLEKAREDGQVARSQDLTIAVTMIFVAVAFFMFGDYFFRGLAEVFSSGFVFDRRILFSPQMLPAMFGKFAVDGLLVVMPIFILTIIIAIASALSMGGFIFSMKAVEPKVLAESVSTGLTLSCTARAIGMTGGLWAVSLITKSSRIDCAGKSLQN